LREQLGRLGRAPRHLDVARPRREGIFVLQCHTWP
jgi:hypothetical protein